MTSLKTALPLALLLLVVELAQAQQSPLASPDRDPTQPTPDATMPDLRAEEPQLDDSLDSAEADPLDESQPRSEGDAADLSESSEPEESPGQDDLDKATQLKLTATNGKQMNDVIQLLASAMKKGLDEDNEAFAKQMLASTLMERGQGLASVLLDQPLPNPEQDPRWLQLRLIALSDLTSAAALDPKELEAWMLIGRLHQLPQGDSSAAREAYTKVIEGENVDDEIKAEALARRATVQDENQATLKDLAAAIEAAGGDVKFYMLRARHYIATQDYQKALADIEAALEAEPDNYGAHELHGLVLRELDRAEEAFKAFDRAEELQPESVMPYLQRAEMYGDLGDMEQAIAQATKAIDRQQQTPLGYLLRADLYLRSDQPQKGLADAERVLELQPGYAPAIWLKARAYDEMDDTQQALEQLEALSEAMPEQTDLELQIALYALKLEMPTRAIAALDRAIDEAPDNATLYRFRGDSYLNLGRHPKAVADYNKALELAPEDPGVLNNLAWTLATSPDDSVRDGQRAVELAQQAAELTHHEQAHILSTLAAAYAESGDFEQAKEWSTKAGELDDGEHADQMAEELETYQRGEPFRERQQLDAGEREGATPKVEEDRQTELEKPSSSTPAPRRSIDF